MGDEGVRSEEAIGGGRNVFSSSAESAKSADHLVIMVHGILGSSADWEYGANQFVKSLSDKVIIHCSERNMNKLTLDGVDVMGERLAEEVVEVINQRPGFQKISFIGHSVGGLVARYAVGKLYRPPNREGTEDPSPGVCEEYPGGTICGLEAINFITVATPHLGSRGNKQVPFLFGVAAIEKFASRIIHWILRRTGRHLFLTDNDGGLPLLQRMVDDHGDLCFMSALRVFKRRVAYANAGCDRIVGWRTSSIRRKSELPKWENSVNNKYPHIVYEEHSKALDEEKCAESSILNGGYGGSGTVMLEERLVTGLSRVPWERVDVSFHSCRQKSAAHSVIQVKHSIAHTEGADVIQHMIDHFLT